MSSSGLEHTDYDDDNYVLFNNFRHLKYYHTTVSPGRETIYGLDQIASLFKVVYYGVYYVTYEFI